MLQRPRKLAGLMQIVSIKKLPRDRFQVHCADRSLAGDISLNGLTEDPVVFSAFAVGETPAPERSEGERGGGKTPPCQKP